MSLSDVDPSTLTWHQPVWRRTAVRLRQGNLPHALLIHGAPGLGKSILARRLARAILCASRDESGEACGSCRSCRLADGAHPDRYHLRPEEGKSRIGIDGVRELSEFLALSSQLGGYRVASIEPADALTAAAANGLLKTLEEPPGDAVLLLVAARPFRLPATIRSRCQDLGIGLPPRRESETWLRAHAPHAVPLLGLAGEAPLAALRLAERGADESYSGIIKDLEEIFESRSDPLTVAAHWANVGVEDLVGLLAAALGDMIRIRAAGCDAARTSGGESLRRLAEATDLRSLYDYMDRLTEVGRILEQPLNEQLAVEGLFVDWWRITR